MQHADLEEQLDQRSRELVRQMHQDRMTLSALQEERRYDLTGPEGEARPRAERSRTRGLLTKFWLVSVPRIAYRAPGMSNVHLAVREAVMAGWVAAEASGRAADLGARWRVLTSEREDEVMPGQWNAWMVFRDLAAEVAGSSGRYESESFTGPGLIHDDPDEEGWDPVNL